MELKERLADLRTRVGDTGEHFPKAEAVVRKFWGYDGEDRARAVEISAEFLRLRETELSEAAKAKGKETTNQPRKSEPSDEEAMEIDINKLERVLF